MDLLTLPVGTLAQGFEPIHAEDSVARAVSVLRGHTNSIIPVVEDGRYIGVISERSLTRAIATNVDPLAPVTEAMESAETLSSSATGAEALRRLHDSGVATLVVLNSQEEPVGLISATDLFPRPIQRPVPPLIGGMATPFGVYLTNGSTHGGVSSWALMSTGVVLALLLIVGQIVAGYAAPHVPKSEWGDFFIGALPLLIFMIGMRSIPLAGTHAAEHKVVHALERGEPLTPAVVKRMPRVHPRCGTNLAVGATLFLFLQTVQIGMEPMLQTVFAAMITLMTYKRLGGFMQWLITTKPPNDKQIESGIKAAEDLLHNYALTRLNQPSFVQRIVNMGIFQVMLGASLTTGLMYVLAELLHLPIQ